MLGEDSGELANSKNGDDSFSSEVVGTKRKSSGNGRTAKNKKTPETQGKQLSMTDMFSKKPVKRTQEEAESINVSMSNGSKKQRLSSDNGNQQSSSIDGSSNGTTQNGNGTSSNGDRHDNEQENGCDTSMKKEYKVNSNNKVVQPPKFCSVCKQHMEDDNFKVFIGDPPNATEEFITLADPSLSLLNADQESALDEIPQHKITGFSVYDKFNHLCPFDTGLIEANVELWFSGSVKAVYDENPDPSGGIPTRLLGPINSWWVAGFDGGEKALIGFTTAYAEYILMEPSEEYQHIMSSVHEKIYLSKVVIEYIEENPVATYEDLLNCIETSVPPQTIGCTSFTEDTLLRHAQFIVEQVESYDQFGDDDEDLLLVSACMRALIKLAGVTLGKRKSARRGAREAKPKKPKHTMATTTNLVQNIFEMFFKNQIENKSNVSAPRRRRCGVCDVCQQPDCGQCTFCKDMVKFGGTGRSKQCCIDRRCPNMAVQVANEDEHDTDVELEVTNMKESRSPTKKLKSEKKIKTLVEWIGEPVIKGKKQYYNEVLINREKVILGDVISLCPDSPDEPLYIARIIKMWEDMNGKKMFHGWWFSRSSDTLLGETGDPCELFISEDCDNNPLGSIMGKVNVEYRAPKSDWFMSGNSDDDASFLESEEDGKNFFYQKCYYSDTARFVDIPDECFDKTMDSCIACRNKKQKEESEIPTVCKSADEFDDETPRSFSLRNVTYSVGECVYLPPGSYKFPVKKNTKPTQSIKKDTIIDEEMYPEKYRKTSDYVKGSNQDSPDPFQIGRIVKIYKKTTITKLKQDDNDIFLKVSMFYRPSDTHKGAAAAQQANLNLLYWSNEETTLSADTVCGKCHIVCGDDVEGDIIEYSMKDVNRFYFMEAYNSQTKEFEDPPLDAMRRSKGKGKGGKGKSKGKPPVAVQEDISDTGDVTMSEFNKLRSLDVFAGVGGLTEGFHQAGVAEACWAIEKEEPAAQAFRLNYPKSTVFTDDCNLLLKLVMEGAETNDRGQRLPQKGDVELLCGGPPCQGFSGMNRFNSREYSQFKNSLVASYLSFCEYYRPKYFVLENVRNFVSFKKSMILKLTLRCLLKMGYQCTFGVLQAGQYGVPQTRRRAIIIAAAPGLKLPSYPDPTHVFSPRACQLTVVVDDKKYEPQIRMDSAPFRSITVRDSMSDLPDIKNGSSQREMSYNGEPHCYFQRMLRGKMDQPILYDHVCKEMNPLVAARMRYIPIGPGSDWRDLPNMVVRLSDGNYSKKLLYTHHDKKNGFGKKKALRGVCPCAETKQCDSAYRQYSTLIPWCLPHTGNRHNHWAGLYGRLEWDGFFSTTVTNPEPMGKQGRVLHPEQNRVVTVRECARSQGFPDTYRFFGTILDKHRQVGNAVPPPLAKAIGLEIKKAIIDNQNINK